MTINSRKPLDRTESSCHRSLHVHGGAHGRGCPTGPGCVRDHAGAIPPSAESLKQYKYPDWFRDAKFGIWAHWGPQAVPMDGDWYARQMYEQGHPQYKDHLEHYGHPSKFGYKDIIPLWKAEKWDPDRLMSLYKKAGREVLRQHGRRTTTTSTSGTRRYHTLERGEDGPAPRRGRRLAEGGEEAGPAVRRLRAPGRQLHLVPGQPRPTRPARSPACPTTAPIRSIRTSTTFPAAAGDTGWYSNDPRWQQRVVPPDQGTGRQLPARPALHRRRRAVRQRGRPEHDRPSLQRERGAARRQAEVVYTCKQKSEGRWVEDLERGVMAGIRPYPWQTDTSIGDWFYNRNWKYRGADWVIHMLVDIVSKNGNLLINVVQRPDGSLDPEAEKVLAEMADVDRDQRRGDLRDPALADLRRRPGPRQGRALQGGLRLHREGHPLHQQGRQDPLRLRPGLACREASSRSARWRSSPG